MAKIGIPYDLQEDVHEFFYKTQSTRDQQEEFDQFFLQISPSLKVKVQNKIFENSLLKNSLIVALMGDYESEKIEF